MTRLSTWITLLSGALLTACGARTSQDELLGGPSVGTGGQAPAGCCSASTTPGCELPSLAECVCAVDVACCTNAWDATCVAEVDSTGCGTCVSSTGGSGGVTPTGGTGGRPPTGGSGGWFPTGGTGGVPPAGGSGGAMVSCCSPHSGTGCNDPMVTSCVCGADPYCCNSNWDSTCVQEADKCGAGCTVGGSGGIGGSGGSPTGGFGGLPTGGVGGGPTGGFGGMPTGGAGATGGGGGITGDCCTYNGYPGCSNDAVEACVCGIDSFCCTNYWDGFCVSEANQFCGAGCSGGGTGGMGGTGGTGGIGFDACMSSLPTSCDSCACSNCLGSYNDCIASGNCVPFAVCTFINNCPCL